MRFFSWLRQWIRTVIAAATRTEFYLRFEERKPREAAGHLALLSVFLWTLPFVVLCFFFVGTAVKSIVIGLREQVPPGTVFEMKNGSFSSSLSEPLVFGDEEFKIVINSASGTAALQAGESGLVVSASGIRERTPLREQEASFANVPDFRKSREELLEATVRWAPFAMFLTIAVMSLVVFGSVWIGFLASTALHGSLLWLALKICKRTWPWKRAFVVSAYAATGPILLNAILSASGLNLGAVSSVWYWLILIWIVYGAVKQSAPAPEKKEA